MLPGMAWASQTEADRTARRDRCGCSSCGGVGDFTPKGTLHLLGRVARRVSQGFHAHDDFVLEKGFMTVVVDTDFQLYLDLLGTRASGHACGGLHQVSPWACLWGGLDQLMLAPRHACERLC